MKALLDTSILVGRERGLILDAGVVPELSAISVITIAELRMGVLTATDSESRAERMRTLSIAESAFEPLPIDTKAAGIYARIRAQLRERGQAIGPHDGLIAATAIQHGARLITQDRDFERVDGLDVTFV